MPVPSPGYRFGVTASVVASAYLSRMVPDTDADDVLDQCISRAASRITQELQAWDITASDITEADYPADYAWCFDAVAVGAASMYVKATTGSDDETLESDFRDRVGRLRDKPQILAIYDPSGGANAMQSHMSTLDAGTVQTLRSRMASPSPARPKQWGTL